MTKYVGIKKGDLRVTHEITESYCGACGRPVADNDSFCSNCGGALRECTAVVRTYADGYYDAMTDAGLERQTLHDMYYSEGYSDGHTDAWKEASIEMKRIRDCLHAILDRGEAPEHGMKDE